MADVNRLLTLANGAALHKALQKRRARVSYRTVARWIGENPELEPKPELVPLILDAFGLTDKEAPEPVWVQGLRAEVIAEIRKNRDEIVRRTSDDLAGLRERMDDALAEIEQPRQRRVEDPKPNARSLSAEQGGQRPRRR